MENARTKNSFTPGPWRVGTHTDIYPSITDIVSDGDKAVCSVSLIIERHANARLIAAAPELLETLESVVKVCDDLGRDGVFSHVMAQARAAIAKATGEA